MDCSVARSILTVGVSRAARNLRGRRAAMLASCLAAITAGADETLTYVLTPEFGTGRTRVEVSWQTAGRTQSALGVSAEYGQIRDVPAMLENVAIEGATRLKRQDGLWICTHRKGAMLHVTYQVNPRRGTFEDWNDVHRPIAADEYFCGIGSTFLLTPNSGAGVPTEFETTLRWNLPAGYGAVCSWGPRRIAGAVMKPTDLRQSVYLAGRLLTKSEKRGNVAVTVALVDRFGFGLDELWRMTSEIIDQQCKFMRETGFPDFVVTAVPVGKPVRDGEAHIAGSGLFRSFALFVAPKTNWDDAIEHLFAHELFHFWNGRTLSAASPERLCYWFIEGMTDYYALRILYESGHWDAMTYAKWLNKHLREYAVNPASNASNDEINEHYWTRRDTVGQVAYQRGHLLGVRWHALARKRGVEGGLDKLLRVLIERGRGGAELTNDALRKTGIETLGAWFGPEFDKYVTGAATVDVPPDALAPGLTGSAQNLTGRDGGKFSALQFQPAPKSGD
jgi:hypothetical protein